MDSDAEGQGVGAARSARRDRRTGQRGTLALGSIGPWATATVFGITVSASGLHGGGWVTLITMVTPGWGLYLALIAVLAGLTTDWVTRIQARHRAAPTTGERP